jgi:uncharacterized membrane protein
MDPHVWARAHGAATHFPLALALGSAAFDAAGLALWRRPAGPELRTAGHWTMLAAAAGTAPAVLSGLLMTRGRLLGHDALRLHHLFAWPAFALLVGLGTWRAIEGRRASRRALGVYLTVAIAAAALISVAGYWGGEMMLAR